MPWDLVKTARLEVAMYSPAYVAVEVGGTEGLAELEEQKVAGSVRENRGRLEVACFKGTWFGQHPCH